MRPHAVVAATGGLALSGVEDKHIVDYAVAVGIVLCEVNLVVEQLACLDYHIFWVAVAVDRVAAIVFTRPGQGDRTDHIENRSKFSARIFLEEIYSRAGAAVVGEPRFVEHSAEIIQSIVVSHLYIGIFDKYHQGFG